MLATEMTLFFSILLVQDQSMGMKQNKTKMNFEYLNLVDSKFSTFSQQVLLNLKGPHNVGSFFCQKSGTW